MDKKNKGLVDDHDGDIILNESGTSVSFGWGNEDSKKDKDEASSSDENKEDTTPKGDEGLVSLG